MFSQALLVSDLGNLPECLPECWSGLRLLGVEKLHAAVCVALHDVPGLQGNVTTIFAEELRRRRDLLAKAGHDAALEVLVGTPHVEVEKLAAATGCDLIVVESRVNSLAGEVFLGGAAADLLHYCRRMMLVLRICACRACAGGQCPLAARQRILFATDFSANAEHAFGALRHLVANGKNSVLLMHVQDRSRIEPHLHERLAEFNAIDLARLERMKESLLADGATEVLIELPYDLPARGILQRARADDIALVIMGSQGRGFFAEVCRGSVSHQVARHAHVPVLLIPALNLTPSINSGQAL